MPSVRAVNLLLVVALAAPSLATAEPRRPDATSAAAVSRGLVLQFMNEQRQKRGLPPLQRSTRLDAAAADRMRDMFERRYFDHVAPDGAPPFVSVRERGYAYTAVGENLAAGQRAARQVVDQWMRSKGHRANILGDFEDIGIAIASGSPTWESDGYTFVVLYGRERRP